MTTSYTQPTRTVNPAAIDAAKLLVGLTARMQRGAALIDQGYHFFHSLTGTSEAAYIVATPGGERYNITFDPARGIVACSCPDCQHGGWFCKHLACLATNRDRIDREDREITAWLNGPLHAATEDVCARCDALMAGAE